MCRAENGMTEVPRRDEASLLDARSASSRSRLHCRVWQGQIQLGRHQQASLFPSLVSLGADICLAGTAPWVRCHVWAGIDSLDEYPNLKRWLKSIVARPTFQTAITIPAIDTIAKLESDPEAVKRECV